MTAPKIMRREDASKAPMRWDRGFSHRLIGPGDGASNVDLHINVINQDSGIGPYHYHSRAENIYIVLEGIAQAIVEGRKYLLVKDDIVFIPPGTRHAAGSAGYGPVTVIEIYAPAGKDFHIVGEPPPSEFVDRPEIVHLLPNDYCLDFK